MQAKKRNTARKHNASDEASKHVPVIAMDHVYMNEVTDDTDNPILVIGDSCCEGIWAVRIKKGGDTAAVKNIVANFLRGFVYSKVVPKSDQEPANRSIDRDAVEILFEDDFQELRGGQVVMQHLSVIESAANGVIENAIQRMQGQVRQIKLDLDMNIKAKIKQSQTKKRWLIEYAAQTQVFWSISEDDGLTAIHQNQKKIYLGSEAQVRRTNHVQAAERTSRSASQKPDGDREC